MVDLSSQSDNLISMKDISATEAARRFSELLDAVEHRHETFIVVRRGHAIARITPATDGAGRVVKDLLLRHRPDGGWASDLAQIRSLTQTEDRRWTD